MEKLNKIEQKLLDKAISDFEAEVEKGAKIIVSAIANLYNDEAQKVKYFKGNKVDEVKNYLSTIIRSRTTYYGGDYTFVEHSNSGAIPEFIKEIMLKRAVDDFFVRFEEMKDVIENIEC